MNVAKDTRFRLAPEVTHRTIEDEVVILGGDGRLFYGLEAVGAFVWRQLEKEPTVQELCRAVGAHYDVGEQRCEADLLELLEQLVGAGLVEPSSPASE